MMWEIYQTSAIGSAQRAAGNASSEARRAARTAEESKGRLADLTSRCDKLALSCQALWELLRERLDLTEQELLDRVQEIDLRDGKADGRMATHVAECPACQRPVNSRRKTCLYCGEPMNATKEVFNQ